jgi:hypothetical protein
VATILATRSPDAALALLVNRPVSRMLNAIREVEKGT